MLIALLGYLFLGDTTTIIPIEKRILDILFTCLLTLVLIITGNTVAVKGLKYKLNYEEIATLVTVVSLIGLGLSNFVSPYLWRSISVFIILLSCYVYRVGLGTLIAGVLGIGLAVYYTNVSYVALFVMYGIFAVSFMPLSRYVSAMSIMLADYLIQVIFNFYSVYLLEEFISILVGAIIFCLIPTKILVNLKEKLYYFRERQLVRQSINRSRTMLSNRLYELSSVFTEMANAFTSLKKDSLTEDGVKHAVCEKVFQSVCCTCEYQSRCKLTNTSVRREIYKLGEIGVAKGKISLIDFSHELGENCFKPNGILFSINKLLAEYKSYMVDKVSLKNGRELVASEALGVSEVLRGLALETGTLLRFQSRLERKLSSNLLKAGFNVSEILIYGEQQYTTVSLIVTMKEFSLSKLKNVILDTTGIDMSLVEKADITEEKCYMSFRKAVEFDAVFGVASLTKDGSSECGDTHSVVRIKEDKFLVALSDGMGSGEGAKNLSSTSLSLIESFYKSGLNSQLILATVNKLLSINCEDTFTALDISVIDLKNCTADFIKYGSPYGFVIGNSGIKIVESNTLPLGILEELKPSVCSTQLEDGDMLLLVSDGISDAFSSSTEMIDYLKSVPAKNPQTLANDILKTALSKNNGQKKDDMTALCVRIFKTTA